MSINIELALVLGLFIIGSVALAIDNLVDALLRRLTCWLRDRNSVVASAKSLRSVQKKKL